MRGVLKPCRLINCKIVTHALCTSRRRPLLCVAAAAAKQPPPSNPTLTNVLQQYRGLVIGAPNQTKKATGCGGEAGASAGAATGKSQSKRAAAGDGAQDNKSRQAASSSNARRSQPGQPKKKTTAKAAAGKQSRQGTSTSSSKSSSGGGSNNSSSSTSSRKASSERRAKPAAAAKPLLPPATSFLPSNGKGFGSLASRSSTRAPAAAVAASEDCSADSTAGSSSSSKRPLKVFRFGVEAAALQRAVNACGWQERVLQVDAIGQADALIAVKDTAGGKHQNLAQGERSAKNAGIPFVVVGRRMTKDSLHKALNPFFNEQSPEEAAARKAELAQQAERKALADTFFSAAAGRFSGRLMSATAADSSVGRLQQQQQQQARHSSVGGGGSSRSAVGPPSSRGNRGA